LHLLTTKAELQKTYALAEDGDADGEGNTNGDVVEDGAGYDARPLKKSRLDGS